MKINDIGLDDSIDLLGVLSYGGLDPNTRRSLAEAVAGAESGGRVDMVPVVETLVGLLMNALANRNSRDEIRGFLFNAWRTVEDEQAIDSERDDFGHLIGEKREAKLRKWRKLKVSDLKRLIQALAKSEWAEDFLSMFKEELIPGSSPGESTASSGSTPLSAAR